MTDKEIVALAKECGFWGVDGWFEQSVPRFRLMVESVWQAATLEEREACAKVCDNFDNAENTDSYRVSARWCAEVIRARTE